MHAENQHPVSLQSTVFASLWRTLIGQIKFRFDKDSLIMAKAVDSVPRCDNEGITAIVDNYTNVLNINRQLLSSEMEQFASTDIKMDINFMQEELKENPY